LDGSRFNSLIDQAGENLSVRKIEMVLGDGAFDRREISYHLQKKGIRPVIKAARDMKNSGSQRWKQKYDYGRRWAAETVFSAVKRIAGEQVAATKTENMMQEVILKFSFYNMLIQ